MKDFFRRISPRRAAEDFADHWKQPTPHRWQILGVSCAATFAVFISFIPESVRIVPERPELIYITTLDENRSEAEIIAANCANQELQDSIEARLEQRAELRKDIYRALGEATFIDVDEMVREAEAERAAQGEVEGPSEEELELSIAEYCARAAA
ncbi:MAG: hypothetical protein WBA68_00775 [Alteraurantiacibacter sp.]